MDQLTSDLLSNWGLGEYIPIFCEGRIDAGTLRLLENDEICQLIPVPGDRTRFKANLKNWKVELCNLKPSESPNATANLPTLSVTDLGLENTSFGSYLELEPLSPTQPSIIKDCATNTPEESTSHCQASGRADEPSSKLNRTSTPIASNDASEVDMLQPGYVLRTLQCTHDGKAILNQGQQSRKLDETQRNLLVKLIIGFIFEKDPNIVISNTQLLNWALEIQETFPNESAALYYTPYVATLVRGTARNASGKLLRYVYFCHG